MKKLLCTTCLVTTVFASTALADMPVNTGGTGTVNVFNSASTVAAELHDQPLACATFPRSIQQGQSFTYSVTPNCTAPLFRARYQVYKSESDYAQHKTPDAVCIIEFTRSNDGKMWIINNDIETGPGAYCAIDGNNIHIMDQAAPAGS